MIPPKEDPRWREIVIGQQDIPLRALATKMILTRVRLLAGADPSPTKMQEAINIAYDFFKKNQHAVADDILLLFK